MNAFWTHVGQDLRDLVRQPLAILFPIGLPLAVGFTSNWDLKAVVLAIVVVLCGYGCRCLFWHRL